jgi:polysaccharide deacetylase family protein (PEP-CTERM system associated)
MRSWEPEAVRAPIKARRVIVNALSVDVEDYFQVWALAPWFPRSKWDDTPCRIERNIDLILGFLDDADVEATFFTLGWIAERYPRMIRRIAAGGHEIASHGYAHNRVDDLERDAFHADIHLAKTILEDVTDFEVKGYRAPSFSISDATEWAHDAILDAGYRYSSSVYPIHHDHYGIPHAPRFAYRSRPRLLEVPITTMRMFDRNFPAGGGGYFRLLPYPVSKWTIRRVNEVEGQPAVFYFHPWELDPEQPRVKGASLKTRFRHYLNLDQTEDRLYRLLRDFRWNRIDRVFLQGDA